MPENMRVPGGKKAYLAAAILLIFLMAASALLGKTDISAATQTEKRMERILGCVAGAGEVRVMIYGTKKDETAAVWNASDNSEEIIGVIIVAQGAGDAAVAARLAKAAGSALGIDQSRIEVFRMDDAAR